MHVSVTEVLDLLRGQPNDKTTGKWYKIISLCEYLVNSVIANVVCYITIPSLNKVLYLVFCILYGWIVW